MLVITNLAHSAHLAHAYGAYCAMQQVSKHSH